MPRNRVMLFAAAVSAAFHLSMVTLFSIVIYFPRDEIDYETFQLVDAETFRPVFYAERPRAALRIPTVAEALGGEEREKGIPGGEDLLPRIEAPVLGFADLRRLRMREEGVRVQARYEEMMRDEARDPWRRLAGDLRPFAERLAGGGDAETPAPLPVSSPAPGYAAYVEWLGPPADRELIYSPPIAILEEGGPSALDDTVALVFRVNPLGRVVEIQTPTEDDGLTASMARSLMKYRFSPLDAGDDRDQHGVLIIAPEDEEVLP